MLRELIGHPCVVLQLNMHPQAPKIMFGQLSGQSTLSFDLGCSGDRGGPPPPILLLTRVPVQTRPGTFIPVAES